MTVSSSGTGLKIYNSSIIDVTDSSFDDNDNDGSYIDDSGLVTFREGGRLSGNNIGLVVRGNSSVHFGGGSEPGEIDVIENDNIGMSVYLDSYLQTGYLEVFGGGNNVYDNQSYDASAGSGGHILAHNTYWGTATPSASQFFVGANSEIDYDPWLTSPAKQAEFAHASSELTPAQLVHSYYEATVESRSETEKLLMAAINHSQPRIARTARMLRARELLKMDASAGIDYTKELLEEESFSPEQRDMLTKQMFYAYLFKQDDEARALKMLSMLKESGEEDWKNGLLSTVFVDATGVPPVFFPQNTDPTSKAPLTVGNYPNPFNSSTVLRYVLSEQGPVTVKMYDLLGREVAVLVNEKQQAGAHSVHFDASHLRSGVYVYQLTTRSGSVSGKMHLVK